MESIGPGERLEIAVYQDFVDNQDTFEAGGLTKEIWDQMFPFLEQQAWSIFELFKLVAALSSESPNILEIGSGKGGSLIAMKLAKPGANFTVIDPFAPYDETSAYGTVEGYPGFTRDAFEENIRPFDIDPKIIQQESQVAYVSMGDKAASYDLIYVDGNHSYAPAKQDINEFQNLLKDGGVFCGHDYHPRFPGVIQACKEEFGVDGFEVKENSSLWVKV